MNLKSIIPLTALVLLLASCDNSVVSRDEYNALMTKKLQIEAEYDSLQFELLDLKMYVDYLEEENTELVEELKNTPLIEE